MVLDHVQIMVAQSSRLRRGAAFFINDRIGGKWEPFECCFSLSPNLSRLLQASASTRVDPAVITAFRKIAT